MVGLAQSLYAWLPIKGKHFEVMGTPVGCLPRTLRYLNVPREPRRSGDPDGLNSKCSRQAARAGDRTGTIAGGVKCQAAGAMCCDKVLLSVGTERHDVGSAGSISTGRVQLLPEKFYPGQHKWSQ
ncbi:hypothetical protein TIFTF001_030262 [Ficus carica]|uniref:Uncharacterized protein n=1 Tax=Ficus carica TaxID=3494 RepID=A0AA88DX97_FICCA|nr:hypothetical protein TIFTF001_030262 [Ficus carica]